jgi:hypothetical protein
MLYRSRLESLDRAFLSTSLSTCRSSTATSIIAEFFAKGIIGSPIQEFEFLFHFAADDPEVFEAICAAFGRSHFFDNLDPGISPFWKREHMGEEFPESVIEGKAFFRSHQIPAISLEGVRGFFFRMTPDWITSFGCTTIGMCFCDGKEELPAFKGGASAT